MYFVKKEEPSRSIHLKALLKHPSILNPWYGFFNKKNEIMFIPFMAGGRLNNFISRHLPLQKDYLIFYINQLILLLEFLESNGKMYSHLTLDTIFVKESGYLVLDGLQPMLELQGDQKLMYRISGNPYYFSPEMISYEGYSRSMVIWKLGICAFYLCTGKFPFEGKNLK